MSSATEEATLPRQLVVGCGHFRMPGWLHADLAPTPATDLCFDLQVAPWPLDDNSMDVIYASHVLEHLLDFRTFFAEAHRVLAPAGTLQVRVPYGLHAAAHWDVTHVTYWVTERFAFVQAGYGRQIGNPQNEAWPYPFQVDMIEQRLSRQLTRLLRWKWVRRRLIPYVGMVQGGIEELFVHLTPLKTPDAVQRFAALNPGTHMPCRYVAWAHNFHGRALAPGEQPALVVLAGGVTANGYN